MLIPKSIKDRVGKALCAGGFHRMGGYRPAPKWISMRHGRGWARTCGRCSVHYNFVPNGDPMPRASIDWEYMRQCTKADSKVEEIRQVAYGTGA